jgi:hypothetical protein
LRVPKEIFVFWLALTTSCSSGVEDPYQKIERISYQFDESDTNGGLYIIDNKMKKMLLLYEVYTNTRPHIRDQEGVSIGQILKHARLVNGRVIVDFYRFTISDKFELYECEFQTEVGDFKPYLFGIGEFYEIEKMLEDPDFQNYRSKCEKKNLITYDNTIWEAKPESL